MLCFEKTNLPATRSEAYPLVFWARKDVFLKAFGEQVGKLAYIHVPRTYKFSFLADAIFSHSKNTGNRSMAKNEMDR